MENENVVGTPEVGGTVDQSPSPVTADMVAQYNYQVAEPESKSYGGVLAAVIGGTIAAAGAVGGWFAMRRAKKKAKKAEEAQAEDSPVVVLPSQSFVIRDIDVATDEEIDKQFAALKKWRADHKAQSEPEKVEGEVE